MRTFLRLAALNVILFAAFFSNAQVTGLAFRDYNSNGSRQNGAGFTEPVLAGVIVNVYNSNDALVASYRTAANGTYSVPATGTAYNGTQGSNTGFIASGSAVRLEFVIPASGTCTANSLYDFSSGGGATYGTAVRFVTAGAAAVNVNFAVNDPNDYVPGTAPFTNMTLFLARQISGNPAGGGTSGTAIAFWKFPYGNKQNTSPTGTPPPNATDLATNAQIGSTYGVAYSKQANRVFASAFFKRHYGLGPANGTFNNAPGAIYILNPNLTSSTGAASYFTSLDALGFPTHNSTGTPAYGAGTSYNITGTGVGATIAYTTNGLGVIGTNAARGLAANTNVRTRDAAAFAQVGRVSLGDIELSDDGQYLFVTNFFDRKLYQLQLNSITNPTAATVVNSWALPAPPLRSASGITNAAATYTGVNNGTNFYDGTRGFQRPFALKYYRGKVYIGAVTTGENGGVSNQDNNTGNPEYTDLWGYVWEFDPLTGLFTSTPVLQFPLNFDRGTNADGQSETWKPWTSTFPAAWGAPFTQYQQPMFSDIEFDADGSMILGFRDRFGDQSAYDEETMNNATVVTGQAMGDMYRAYFNPSTCAFEMEQNAKEGPGSAKAATAGANNGDGPSNYTTNNGEFYYQDEVYDANTNTTVGTFHLNCTGGALAIIKGTDTVTTTTMDPIRAWSGGVSWFSNTSGVNGRDYEVFAGAGAGNFPTAATGDAGKSNGLGDIELLNSVAPTEIGNRVWNDVNGNGIQDANEAGLANVSLQLFTNGPDGIPGNADDVPLGTTTTDGTGNWYFNAANVTDGDPNTAGNQAGPQPGIAYNVRITAADWTGGAGTGDLLGYQLTKTDKIGNGAVDLSDNDAALNSSNVPMITFTITAAGRNNHNLDFGFKQLAAIGDKVWRDDDKDGTQDAGEPGVAGITVELFVNGTDGIAGTADDVKIGTTITDAYGNYLFDNLTPTNQSTATTINQTSYNVKFTLPANYTFTSNATAGDNSNNTNSDATPATGRTGGYNLTSGEKDLTVDAGIIFAQPTTASVGDRVWLDTDNDGVQDATESGVAGVTVTLYNNAGVAIASTTTDANGNYNFTNLTPGTYSVGFTLPVGFNFGTKDAGGNDDTDSDVNTSGVNFGKTDNFTLAAGENKINVDAGLIQAAATTASVGDRVWFDLDQDGIQDAGEPGVPGVTVTLYQGGSPIRTTVTDVFGNYIFNNLAAGSGYQVGITVPGGYALSPSDAGADNSVDSDILPGLGNRTSVFSLAAGTRNLTLDGGIYQTAPAGTASVGDKVWFDADGDGVQDAGEPGVPGVVVTLYNNSGTAIATTTTDANGFYLFPNLAAGTYSVGFSNFPPGYGLTGQDLGGNDNTDSDANPATGRTASFALAVGENKTNVDAGLVAGQASGLGSLGNKVWYDLDNDGLQDAGELGVPGVTVTLSKDINNDGDFADAGEAAFATTITNSLGEYIFPGLDAGTYRVQFSTLPAGYAASPQNAGTDDAIDSDGGVIGGGVSTTGVYTLGVGEDNLTVDLGLNNAARNTLGNLVWLDANADGVQSAGEPGIAGVMVALYNDGADNIAGNGDDVLIGTTSTDINGNYLFSNLADDTYYVRFSNVPSGLDFSSKDLGGNDANDSDADRTSGTTGTYTLNAGNRSDLTVDGGLITTRAALGNYVWLDANGDGVQDAAEAGVAGVTVSLFFDANNDGDFADAGENLPVASMITNQNGQYLFTNLTPGNYQVAFTTVPSGLYFTQQNTPGDNGNNTNSDADRITGRTATVVLTANETDLTIDAGLYKPQATVGNFVWVDLNSDGDQDAGEPGIGGVLVSLVDVATGQPVAVTVTDGNGGYIFPNVAPGTYYIQFANLPSGASFTSQDQASGNDNLDSDVNPGTGRTPNFVVPPTGVNLTFDAGVITNISILPVKLELTAVKRNNTAVLTWKVSGENGVSTYEVERAADGRNFSPVGSVTANGSSQYTQDDLQPQNGLNYYRIKVINNSGSIEYSAVRTLSFGKDADIQIFPNPAKNTVNITLPESWQGQALKFELFNTSGQLMMATSSARASQVENLDISKMASGIYQLRITAENTQVIVKQVSITH